MSALNTNDNNPGPSSPHNADFAANWIRQKFAGTKIRKLLLIQPPDTPGSRFQYQMAKRGRYTCYPPYGLATLAALVRLDGIEVKILDLNKHVLERCYEADSSEKFSYDAAWSAPLLEALETFKPDFACVSIMFSYAHDIAADICRVVRRHDPELLVGLGGVHVTNTLNDPKLAEKIFNDFSPADFFFVYEADRSFPNFLRFVNGAGDSNLLAQVVIRSVSEPLRILDRQVPEADVLDVIPAHDLVLPRNYSKYGMIGVFGHLKEEASRKATALLGRGCRAKCTFCSVRTFNGVGVRQRSIQSVVDELLVLNNEHGIDHIMWLDDDFLYDQKRSVTLFNEMVKQGVKLTWDCTNGVIAASCKDEVIAAAAESGCNGLAIGMESGNADILRQIQKPGTPEVFMKAAEVLRKYETIYTWAFLIVGFPGESYRQLQDTLNVAKAMKLDWYGISHLQALPGTPIYNEVNTQVSNDELQFSSIHYSDVAQSRLVKSKLLGRKNTDVFLRKFDDAFDIDDFDSVPDAEGLYKVWNSLYYTLNLEKLFAPSSPVKLRQQITKLKYQVDLIATESAFAMFFLCLLQKRLMGQYNASLHNRLKRLIDDEPTWQERFRDHGLKLSMLDAEPAAYGNP
jgi:radical SAM superfamily enzyme YgiQ (UPF0313 family)